MTKSVYLLLLVPLLAVTLLAQWPGQPGNTVGHTAWPGWTGSFNATVCGAPSSGSSWANAPVVKDCTYSTAQSINCNYCIFQHVDFNAGVLGTSIGGSHMLFVGDRFQSNNVQDKNVGVTGSDIYFLYDSIVPLVSLYTVPPGYTWPSAGSGSNSTAITEEANAIDGVKGYEYGFKLANGSGPVWIDHCDMWGFADAVVIQTTTTQMTLTNNHMHDIPNPTDAGYHTDGPGYSDGGVGPSNVSIIGNTVAMLGNTNSLALQAATGGYQNLRIDRNYWAGNGNTVAFCQPGAVRCTNSTFYGNAFGTDVMPYWSAIYSGGAALDASSVWACNTVSVRSGTTWSVGGWTPTAGMNGQYFNNAATPNSVTDQGGNTYCGVPSPSSLNFNRQQASTTSAGKVITFTNTNTGTLSISSVALAAGAGSKFAVTGNTCGATLTSGNSCAITVAFAPTAYGPQTDTLQIATNSPGVSSPHIVPLLGIGDTSSDGSGGAATPVCAVVAGSLTVSGSIALACQ